MSRQVNTSGMVGSNPVAARARRATDVAAEIASTGDGQTPTSGNASRAVRVLCVDDHAVLVEGLKARFAMEGEIEVVGRLATAARMQDEVERLRPDVVLLDIEMPGPDAFEMADRLRQKHPEVRVVVLSAHIKDAFISASFRSGVCGYFAKSDELEDIIRGIHEVTHSKAKTFLLGPKVRERCRPLPDVQGVKGAAAADVTYDARTGTPVTLTDMLTPREEEILRLICKGLSRTQIAAQLCRSVKTVDAHQGRMMKKLGIEARADLMRFAIREGMAQA